MLKSIALVILGGISSLALVISCGDDGNPADAADAAAGCDCADVQPDLASRIVRVTETTDVQAGSFGAVVADCPDGATLLGGSCNLAGNNLAAVLSRAGIATGTPNNSWDCAYADVPSQPNTIVATAICLIPPPAN